MTDAIGKIFGNKSKTIQPDKQQTVQGRANLHRTMTNSFLKRWPLTEILWPQKSGKTCGHGTFFRTLMFTAHSERIVLTARSLS